jgi:hypothetical protein
MMYHSSFVGNHVTISPLVHKARLVLPIPHDLRDGNDGRNARTCEQAIIAVVLPHAGRFNAVLIGAESNIAIAGTGPFKTFNGMILSSAKSPNIIVARQIGR